MNLGNISQEIFSEMYFKKQSASSSSSSSSSGEFLATSGSESDLSDERVTKKGRVENFIEHVVPNYTDEEFKEHFRLTRTAMDRVEELVKCCFQKQDGFTGGRKIISAKKGVHFFIWYLANQETFRQICDRFNVSAYSGFHIVKKVSAKLCEVSGQFIKFPPQECFEDAAKCFKKKKGLSNVIGAIDGSHIPIRRPENHEADYVNRKQFHSILLQGICDSNKKFIDVYCGEPGSLHDARLLRKSSFYRFVTAHPGYFRKFCLLGDSAYPSLTWLVPPFRNTGALTPEQAAFNIAHSATRVVIENAFGLLKGRFRRLRYFENLRIDIIINCVMAACVLHNICIDIGDGEDFDVDDPDAFVNNDDIHTNNMQESEDRSDGHLPSGWVFVNWVFKMHLNPPQPNLPKSGYL